jgi:hypothetical protein
MLELVTLQSLAAKCCKMRKIYSPAKFANFVLICIARGKMHHIWAESGAFSRAQYKLIQKLQISQGYIFLILQHFATKLCNFTNFKLRFLVAVMDFVVLAEIKKIILFFLPRSSCL